MLRHLTALFFSLFLMVSPVWSFDIKDKRNIGVKPINKIEPIYKPIPTGLVDVKVSAIAAIAGKAEKSVYYAPMEREFPELDYKIATEEPRTDVIDANIPKDGINLPTDSIRYHVNKAKALFDKVTESNAFVKLVNPQTLMEFPVGITKTFGNVSYTIVIEEVVLTPVDAYFSAYMRLEVPQLETPLTFMAREVHFTKDGGMPSQARLELLEDLEIPLSEHSLIRFIAGSTFVNMDCNGYKNMGLSAEVEFSRDLLVPENPDGSLASEGRVTGSFETVVTSLQDLIVELNLSPFQLAKKPGYSFAVSTAVFDLSDTHNHPAVKFPEGYQSTSFIEGNQALWQGFYLQEAFVKLPPEFNKSDNPEQRISITASNLIIDDMGFTGNISAENLILMKEGNMDGWAYSLDSIGIDIVASDFAAAALKGEIHAPVFKEGQNLAYGAIIDDSGDFIFNARPQGQLEFSAFAADVQLEESSYLEVIKSEGKFKPTLFLNGRMDVDAELRGKKVAEINGITFEGMRVASDAPHLSVEYISFGDASMGHSFNGFSFIIDEIDFYTSEENKAYLGFDVNLALAGQAGGSIGGEARLYVVGNLSEDGGLLSYAYEGVEISKLGIDVDAGGFKLKGSVEWFKADEIYGKGFRGQLDAYFSPGIEVKAVALFGTANGSRYWMADALATFPAGIPIAPNLGIYGMGGGATYHMKPGQGSSLGQGLSGITYAPDPTMGLGIKAAVELRTMSDEATFNGDISLEVLFNEGGGLNRVSLAGNGYFVTPPMDLNLDKFKSAANTLADMGDKVKSVPGVGLVANGSTEPFDGLFQATDQLESKKGQIKANMYLSYDVPAKTFHGNLKVYVNIAEGVVRGINEGGLAGEAVIHFAPEEWYIQIGTPDKRIGLELVKIARTESYLMAGHNIPGSPAPDENVGQILGGIDLDYMRDENALGLGKGFAFGSRFSVDTGKMTFLMFYARFAAGAGFDIMMKNYGTEVRCSGRSGPIGVNGWYANGQAYAYFDGKIGIEVDLPFVSGKFEIMHIAAAAVLQAKLPNPFWMRGIVGGQYNILNGLVKGSCKFEVTIGEECELNNGDILAGIDVIAELTPSDEEEVDVFNAPQAVFNLPVGEIFQLYDVDGLERLFRIKLEEFRAVQDGAIISASEEWNAENTVLALNPYEILAPNKEVVLYAKVSFEERINGRWVQILKNGRPQYQEMAAAFVTGEAPSYIPENNVSYSYPVINQYNYYKEETSSGYIKLKQGQNYLFEADSKWNLKGKLTTQTGQSEYFDFNYNSRNFTVDFDMPSGLQNNSVYTLELVKVPAQEGPAVDENVEVVTASINDEASGNEMEINTRKAEGRLDILQEETFYTTHFRTSQYNTFDQKMNALSISSGWKWPIVAGIHELGVNVDGNEMFDRFETGYDGYEYPLVVLEADLSNLWYSSDVAPFLYDGYEQQSAIQIRWRTPELLGVPPIYANSINQQTSLDGVELSEDEAIQGFALGINGKGTFSYNLPYTMYQDYLQLRQFAANQSNRTQWMNSIISNDFPSIRYGTYNMKMKYRLPGTNQITSEVNISILID